MNLKRRIEKIEALRPPPPAICPACGSIDWNTGEGHFRPGVVLNCDDGTSNCFCKRCARTFNARLDRDEDWPCVVTNARLCNWI